MHRVVLGLAAVLILAGCGPKQAAGGGSETITVESFLAEMGVDGAVGGVPWLATEYAGIEPPMDEGLIDAMADPFTEDAVWVKAEGKAVREGMLGKLTGWWKEQPSLPASELESSQIASRFSMAVSARILMARLLYLQGENEAALKSAVETMEIARSAFETAPGMVCADLMPSVVMAAEALARMGEQGGGSPEMYEAGLEAMRFSIFERVAGSVSDDFYLNQLPVIVEQMNQTDQAATVVNVVDPMGEGDEPVERIEAALKGNKTVELKSSADLAKEILARYSETPKDFAAFAELRSSADTYVARVWGENIFEIRPENWSTNMHDPVEEYSNPAGVIYLAAVERKWLTTIEGSYLMQMSLDGARLRLSNTMLARDMINDEREKLKDPLTGGKYEIDMQNEVLRTTLKDVDPKFIFVNQIVQSGVPLNR